MAGRGGRSSSTLTKEQLQSMGITGKDVSNRSANQSPPPLYPPLMNKPVVLDNSLERQYKVMWKDDYANFLANSPFFRKSMAARAQEDVDQIGLQKPDQKPDFCWNMMPSELRPNFKRKAVQSGHKFKPNLKNSKRMRVVNVDEKLKQLEAKENQSEVKIKTEPSDDEEEPAEMEDDEMDDENDYDNNYFDNGESFNEDDDNLDDGPMI